MPLLTTMAQDLSLDNLRRGVVEEIVTTDQMFGLMPFRPVNGKAYVYNREATLSEADFVDTNDVINEGAATSTKITQTIKRIVGDVDVDDFLDETMNDQNDQSAIQIAKKSKGVARKYARTAMQGDETTDPKSFNGMYALATAGQTIYAGANGGNLSYNLLDQLIDLNKIEGQKAFVMHSRTLRSYMELSRALGGATIEMVGNLPGITGAMPAYRGIPILRNDFNPVTRTRGSSGAVCTGIFLATMDENEGLCGLVAGSKLGINVKVVGTVQNKDATRYRVRWYSSLALHSTLALALCDGLLN